MLSSVPEGLQAPSPSRELLIEHGGGVGRDQTNFSLCQGVNMGVDEVMNIVLLVTLLAENRYL